MVVNATAVPSPHNDGTVIAGDTRRAAVEPSVEDSQSGSDNDSPVIAPPASAVMLQRCHDVGRRYVNVNLMPVRQAAPHTDRCHSR